MAQTIPKRIQHSYIGTSITSLMCTCILTYKPVYVHRPILQAWMCTRTISLQAYMRTWTLHYKPTCVFYLTSPAHVYIDPGLDKPTRVHWILFLMKAHWMAFDPIQAGPSRPVHSWPLNHLSSQSVVQFHPYIVHSIHDST